MAKRDDSKKPKTPKSKNAPKSVEFNLDGNVDKSVIVVGDKATVNYYAAVSANTKQNDPDFWNLKHPYPMPPNFTGRIDERAMLTQWLDGDSENRLFILRALGGFGKSALAWQWLTHDVNPKTWKKVVFWSFYEGDASFDHFVEETLKYLNREVTQGKRDQVDALLRAMQADNILLIMDGFERALRAYNSMNAAYQGDEEPKLDSNQLDCVDINAEWFFKGVCALPNLKSKVLMTTRLTPRVVMVGATRESSLQGCYETELTAMQKMDAVEFFHQQRIKGNRVEIESACEPYGYHPLSLRLLAGRILKDFQTPGDISVAQRLKIDGDIIQQKHHVLEVSYNSLPKPEQKLLSTIACFRSPVEYKILQSLHENQETLESHLRDLMVRSLLHFDEKNKKFDLHPIVRRYAYDNLIDKAEVHIRLQGYFESIPRPSKTENVQELSPVIELFHHTAYAGHYREALVIFQDRLNKPLYIKSGEYILCIQLLENLLTVNDREISFNDPRSESWLLNKLALCYNRVGRLKEAELTFKRQIAIRERMNYLSGVAIGLGNLSEVLVKTGQLESAIKTLKRKIDISLQIGDQNKEMVGRQDYGQLLAYQGDFEESIKQQMLAIDWLSKNQKHREEGVSWVFCAFVNLFEKNINELFDSLGNAERLVSVEGRKRDIVRLAWISGAAYRQNKQYSFAEEKLNQALLLDREINLVEFESDILLELARLYYEQKRFEESKSIVDEALLITERCGYVLQGADVNLFLAQYALEQEKDKVKAKEYAEEAKKLATCDGPPYYYKVAYEEAERMLEKL